MMSISHCYCSDYMTKPTQFGDEPKNSLKSQSQLEKRAQSNSTTLFIIHIIY